MAPRILNLSWMEVSGQLHDKAALSLGKQPLLGTHWIEATFKRIIFYPYSESNPDSSVTQPVVKSLHRLN
jgi:hypothetical protein